jgi:hypothetical protein
LDTKEAVKRFGVFEGHRGMREGESAKQLVR